MPNKAKRETETIIIAALNQYVFCPRRCALMFVEGNWSDNEHTAIGSLLHDHTDEPGYETDAGVTLLRALPLFSARYGLTGKADIVEVREGKHYAPVEYKKGRRRKWDNDDVQLCAQAFCLEEMFSVAVPEGFIYHAASKRRRKVIFDEQLRAETERTIEAVRTLLAKGEVPPAVLLPRCDGCSLRSICLPELTQIKARTELDHYGRSLWT
ncbi:MAG: CRISPR-associated protein Cas4 [Pyrinomonadaceae bacterium]|nr:CRISPR-associated protein Cas4 [Pyrinomonadaceae bacterium]